ncbi:MAG TPA: zinc-binding dehydrogenase [Enterococcus casseliflavus]|nr:zinc-binding dehydrogenase [Enterococcus casseliflavus]
MLTIQWLKIAGVKTIIGIDIQSEKLKQALDLGVTDTIDSSVQDLEKEISRITDGLGVDIAMECAGTKITEEQCLLVTKKDGKIGFQGITYSDVLIKQRAFEKIFRSELTIKGFWNSYSAPFPGKEWFDSITFLESGRLSASHMISHRFPLEYLQRAFDLAVNRSESFNKIMIML